MTAISEAVILMAGQGSRLRGSDKTPLKPFVSVLGRPLICYTIEALIRALITKGEFKSLAEPNLVAEAKRVMAQIKAQGGDVPVPAGSAPRTGRPPTSGRSSRPPTAPTSTRTCTRSTRAAT